MKNLNTYSLVVFALALVYILFGIPKILGSSSVSDLIQASYPFFNTAIIALLGVAEVIIGIGLLIKKTRSYAAIAVILHLLGTFSCFILNWNYFFNSKTIFTISGEFVFKNIVYIAVAIYILSIENNFKSIKFLNKPSQSK